MPVARSFTSHRTSSAESAAAESPAPLGRLAWPPVPDGRSDQESGFVLDLIESLPGIFYVLDHRGRLIRTNRRFLQVTGYSEQELLGMDALDFFADEDRELIAAKIQEAFGRGDAHIEADLLVKSGRRIPHQFSGRRSDVDGRPCLVGLGIDLSERREAKTALRLVTADMDASQRIAAAAFETSEGIVVTNAAGVILRVNRAFTRITGYTADELIGQTPRVLKSNRHSPAFYREMWQSLLANGSWQGEIWDRRKNGEEYPKWLTISAVRDEQGVVTHYVGTHADISERKRVEQQVHALAFFDQLTGLPNRSLLLDRLQQAMAAGEREHGHGALLFIDLDNFKGLNDSFGHYVGDLLLQQVGQRLNACLRAGDTLARLGGDEFVVLLPALGPWQAEAAATVEAVASKILLSFTQPFQLDAVSHRCTASIGAAQFQGNGTPADELMKQADLAMYKSKWAGRNAWHFFDPTMETSLQERVGLEKDLWRALDERQFTLHYQPQVVDGGRLQGVEALVRWQHPERGLVSPGEFIPVAEETGLILPLGEWVLEAACTQLAAWAGRPVLGDLTIAVNVSARQFHQRDFADRVLAILGRTGADPRRLKLELTESLLVADVEGVVGKMTVLKAAGISFALDDFGTGYSSLSYLKRLPLAELKIDQSFVRDVLGDPSDAAIARTVVALAKNLGLGVIAEGVETEAQREFLAASGCSAYQGYLFGRPQAAADIERLAG